MPSTIAITVIPLVRFTGPKKTSNPIAIFSTAAATKTGTRIAGSYALKMISPPTTRISTPQCRTKNTETPAGQLKMRKKKRNKAASSGDNPRNDEYPSNR
jgi:hypothetical protein